MYKRQLQYHIYGEGEFKEQALINKLARFRDGDLVARKMMVGAAEWPIVTATMGMAQPVWDYFLSWVEYFGDNAFGIEREKPVFLAGTTWGEHLKYNIFPSVLQSPKKGLYMGPLIYVLSRPGERAIPGTATDKIAYAKYVAGEKFTRSLVGKVYNFNPLSKIAKIAPQSWTSEGLKLSLAKIGLNLSLAKIGSLVYIAGFVTGVERVLKTIDRVGVYTDITTGNFNFARAEYEGLDHYIERTYPGYSPQEREIIGWTLLLTMRHIQPSEEIKHAYQRAKGYREGLTNVINEQDKAAGEEFRLKNKRAKLSRQIKDLSLIHI